MKSKSLNFTISPLIATPLLIMVIVIVGVFEWKSVLAKENRENPKRVIDMAYCTKCHSDEKMLKRMKYKEGSTHFLFNDKSVGCPVKSTDVKKYDAAVSQFKRSTPSTTHY